MRKSLIVAGALAGLLISSSAFAAPYRDRTTNAAEAGTGAVVGTAAGVGLYNGWWGATAGGTSLAGATVGTSVAAGGVAGIGTVALIDAVVQPCDGFNALFGLNKDHCVNGQYVENLPRHDYRR